MSIIFFLLLPPPNPPLQFIGVIWCNDGNDALDDIDKNGDDDELYQVTQEQSPQSP